MNSASPQGLHWLRVLLKLPCTCVQASDLQTSMCPTHAETQHPPNCFPKVPRPLEYFKVLGANWVFPFPIGFAHAMALPREVRPIHFPQASRQCLHGLQIQQAWATQHEAASCCSCCTSIQGCCPCSCSCYAIVCALAQGPEDSVRAARAIIFWYCRCCSCFSAIVCALSALALAPGVACLFYNRAGDAGRV